MKIPKPDPVKTCGQAITEEDFRDEQIIAESYGPGQTPREAMARLRRDPAASTNTSEPHALTTYG